MTAPAPDRPLIVACLRITDLRPDVDSLTGVVTRDAWGIGLSAADAAALEHALRIAEAWSGRVVAVSVGPSAIEPVLREVAALGASVVRIPTPEPEVAGAYTDELAGDEQALARTIADALSPFGPPDLVLCGDRSADRGTGALPAFLAHQLGAVQALGLVTLEVEPGGDAGRPARVGATTLLAERRLDAGWREQLRLVPPAVCSVEGAGVRLRRAPLSATLAAAGATIGLGGSGSFPDDAGDGSMQVGPTRVFAPPPRVLPAPPQDDPRLRLLALTGALVAHEPPTLIGPIGAVEAADELLGFLVRHGYLDHPPAKDDTAADDTAADDTAASR
jgi:electron transfer flavoprotein beta subunit